MFNIHEESSGKAIIIDDQGEELFLGDKVTVEWKNEIRSGTLCYSEDYMRFEIELYDKNGTVDDFAYWGIGGISTLIKQGNN